MGGWRVNVTETDVLKSLPTNAFIGGEWRESASGRRLDVVDPATGRVLTQVADATPADATAALDAAAGAQDAWAATAPRERGEILRRAFEAMIAREDELALLVTLEMGKPIAEARAEVRYAAEFFRWFGEEAVRFGGRWSTEPGGNGRLLTLKQPVGPCLLVTPWNFPLAMGARKIGPAIAAGCTMLVKAAQLTPLSMNLIAAILAEAGLPAGVLNVFTASSASSVTGPLLADRRLRKLSFTGSTEVGKLLIEQSAANLLRVSMELGGNAPFLVFEDADLDLAVEQATIAKMRNMGESCVAANRFYVHRSVAEEFADRLSAVLEAMPVGRGTEPGVTVGPLIDDNQRGKVAELVEDALASGARVRTGGGAVEGDGYFFAPTVLTNVSFGSRMHREEIFGPVAPVYPFDSDDEALRLANDTEYGLIAYVFCRDFQRSVRIIEGLETGMVGLNKGLVSNPAAPFGGVKWSGLGREGGPEGIEEYLNTKYAGIAA
jgi:succinate-semialdehyde dehydrogenase/glutarate-semialdehyde dehydrogenase